MRCHVLALGCALVSATACRVPDKVFSDHGPDLDAGVDAPVDAPPPVIPDTAISKMPASVDNSVSVMFEFTSTVAASTFECTVDGGAFAGCTSPATVGGLTDGTHTFKVRATAGGQTDPTPAEYTWTLDTSTPDTTITGNPGNLVNTTSAQFAFSSPNAGGGATFECQLDGGGYAACTSPKAYTVSEGAHTFQARVRNAAGTFDPTPAAYGWRVDITPPDTMIASGPSNPTQLGLAVFTFSTSEQGSTFQCSVDGAAFATCSSPFRTWGDDGNHTVRIRARDAAGNVDLTPATYSWTAALANIMFVARGTSTNLGGITGGDNLCMQVAQASGFQGTYRAWLSTTTVNAVDRLGSKRGWIRVDGKPFVDTVANLLAGKIYYPPTLYADGSAGLSVVSTGTGPDGKYAASDGACQDWTSTDTSLGAAAGTSTMTTTAWTVNNNIGCGGNFHDYYCFGVDKITGVAPPVPSGRIAFLSVGKWLPGGGLIGADAVCASEAASAGLSGTFKAVLATSTVGSLARFSSSGAPWVRVDGTAITQTAAQLFDPNLRYLDAPINVTAQGAYIGENQLFTDLAWTGPRLTGARVSCLDWTSSDSSQTGSSALNAGTQVNTEMSDFYAFACNVPRRLYCFQQ